MMQVAHGHNLWRSPWAAYGDDACPAQDDHVYIQVSGQC